MDFEAIKKAAEGYKPAMVKFLRDMIAIPSESCEEEGVVKRIAEELKALGYDKVEFDKLGNVIGWMGEGDKIIALDSHVDTVGIGNRDNWEADPYQGYETDDIIYGRGGSDQEGGMASATYGARIMKDLGLIPAVGGHGDGGFLLLLPTGSTEQESQQQAGEQNLFHGGTPFSLGEGLNTGQFFQRGNAVFQGACPQETVHLGLGCVAVGIHVKDAKNTQRAYIQQVPAQKAQESNKDVPLVALGHIQAQADDPSVMQVWVFRQDEGDGKVP